MDLQNRRFVILGGSGFIGSHVVDQLLARNVGEVVVFGSLRNASVNLAHVTHDHRLKCIEGSVSDKIALRRCIAGSDGVFLLTSLWLKECTANPRACFDINVAGGYNVIEACSELGIRRLVYASSSAIYGGGLSSPITETHPLDGASLYSASKISVERFLCAFHQMYGLEYAICRYTNVYGPRQQAKGDATSVVVRFLNHIAAKERPIILGTGRQRFDFIYVQDVALATALAMEAEFESEALNIASGVSTSINELVNILLELTGSRIQPVYQPGSDGVDYSFDTTKASRLLGFRAHTGLEDGLRSLIHWRTSQHKFGGDFDNDT